MADNAMPKTSSVAVTLGSAAFCLWVLNYAVWKMTGFPPVYCWGGPMLRDAGVPGLMEGVFSIVAAWFAIVLFWKGFPAATAPMIAIFLVGGSFLYAETLFGLGASCT